MFENNYNLWPVNKSYAKENDPIRDKVDQLNKCEYIL